jgi:hypothetical protein
LPRAWPGKNRAVRVMFGAYLVAVVAGLAVYITVGVLQH